MFKNDECKRIEIWTKEIQNLAGVYQQLAEGRHRLVFDRDIVPQGVRNSVQIEQERSQDLRLIVSKRIILGRQKLRQLDLLLEHRYEIFGRSDEAVDRAARFLTRMMRDLRYLIESSSLLAQSALRSKFADCQREQEWRPLLKDVKELIEHEKLVCSPPDSTRDSRQFDSDDMLSIRDLFYNYNRSNLRLYFELAQIWPGAIRRSILLAFAIHASGEDKAPEALAKLSDNYLKVAEAGIRDAVAFMKEAEPYFKETDHIYTLMALARAKLESVPPLRCAA